MHTWRDCVAVLSHRDQVAINIFCLLVILVLLEFNVATDHLTTNISLRRTAVASCFPRLE